MLHFFNIRFYVIKNASIPVVLGSFSAMSSAEILAFISSRQSELTGGLFMLRTHVPEAGSVWDTRNLLL